LSCSPSRSSAAARNEAPSSSTWSTCSASRRTSRLTTQAAVDGFFSPFIRVAADASPPALSSLARRSRSGVKSPSATPYSSSTWTAQGSGSSAIDRLLVEPLLDRVAPQLDAVVQLQLAQGVLHVVLDGAVGEHQPVGDLASGEPLRDQPEHLGLALGQPRGLAVGLGRLA